MRAGAFFGAAQVAAGLTVLFAAGALAVLAGCESAADVTMGDASVPADGDGGDARPAEGDGGSPSDGGLDAPTDAIAIQEGATDAAMNGDAAPAVVVDAAPPTPSVAAVRVANWSTDVPAVDFCVAPHGSGAFQGPLLAAAAGPLADAGPGGLVGVDAGSPWIAFPSVGAYVDVSPGQYDVRLVVAGAGSCAVPVPLVADPTPLVPMTANSAVTLAIVGQGSTHKLVSFFDDVVPAVNDAGEPSQLALRFIDTVPDLGSMTFGTNTLGTSFSPIFQGVAFGQASAKAVAGDAGTRTDSNGYALLGPFSSQVVSAHPASTPDGSAPTEWGGTVTAGAGAALTFVLIGSSANASVGLLWCIDDSGLNSSTVSLTSACQLVPP